MHELINYWQLAQIFVVVIIEFWVISSSIFKINFVTNEGALPHRNM